MPTYINGWKDTVDINWNLPTIAVHLVNEKKDYFLQGEEAQDLIDLAATSPTGTIESFIVAYFKNA